MHRRVVRTVYMHMLICRLTDVGTVAGMWTCAGGDWVGGGRLGLCTGAGQVTGRATASSRMLYVLTRS